MEWMVLIIPVAFVGFAVVLVNRGRSRVRSAGRRDSSGGESYPFVADSDRSRDGRYGEGDDRQTDGRGDATPDTDSGSGNDSGGGFDGGGGDGGSD